jgi:hypothetical protein
MARRGLLTQTAEPAKEVLGVETIDVVTDKGYFKIEDIEACEKAAKGALCAAPAARSLGQGGAVQKGCHATIARSAGSARAARSASGQLPRSAQR